MHACPQVVEQKTRAVTKVLWCGPSIIVAQVRRYACKGTLLKIVLITASNRTRCITGVCVCMSVCVCVCMCVCVTQIGVILPSSVFDHLSGWKTSPAAVTILNELKPLSVLDLDATDRPVRATSTGHSATCILVTSVPPPSLSLLATCISLSARTQSVCLSCMCRSE